jgi:hypothetical protein
VSQLELKAIGQWLLSKNKASAEAEACDLCGLLLLDHFFVFAAETFHTACGIDQFLLAGEERMAIGADFQADFAFVGRPCGELVAARAVYVRLVICGMNSWLHWPLKPFRVVKTFILT